MKKEGIKRLEIQPKNNAIPIFIGCGYTKADIPLHAHNYYELELVLDGTATHIINGERYEIGRGSAYILSPLDFHKYDAHSPIKAFCLNFDASVISPKLISKIFSLDKSKPITLSEERIADASAIGNILMKECRREDGGCSIELCESFLTLILADIVSPNRKTMAAQEFGMQRAIAYLNAHFFENPTLDDMAKIAGYNSSYFSDVFKKYTGESYVSRLNSLKIEYSKVLLSHGSRVIDACFDSGFRSLSSFLSAFKKHTGASPNDYKKLHSK